MARELEYTGSFVARSEDGRLFTVQIRTWFDVGTDMAGESYRCALQQELRTVDGDDVQRLSQGRYRVMTRDHHGPVDAVSDNPIAP